MHEAENMQHLVSTKGGDDRLKFKVLASVFYEPSTRTSSSFNAGTTSNLPYRVYIYHYTTLSQDKNCGKVIPKLAPITISFINFKDSFLN
jgi:aspartate carbamoyltransferase catalytic subunit